MTDYSPAQVADLDSETALAAQAATYRTAAVRAKQTRVRFRNEDGTPILDETATAVLEPAPEPAWWTARYGTLVTAVFLFFATGLTRPWPLASLALSVVVAALLVKIIADKQLNKAGLVITWFFLIMAAMDVLSAVATLP